MEGIVGLAHLAKELTAVGRFKFLDHSHQCLLAGL
jgi:hypothetical protein